MIRIINAKEFSRNIIRTHEQDVSSTVHAIIEDVRTHGDAALLEYEHKFDDAELSELAVSQEEIEKAVKSVGRKYMGLLDRAAENIRSYHSRQLRGGFIYCPKDGVILGQRVMPLRRVGLYIPGGSASYPSSVLMNAIPAKLAGCPEIVIATPPKIKNEIIAAAHVAGVTQIYKMGGAQAIAAFAYGTESIPRVDKIVGPGNMYVAEAKRQVFGQVAIDMIAGPSEILIIADRNNNPEHIAADMLAQAEHDKSASAILITNSKIFARNVAYLIESQIKKLARQEIARASIDDNSVIILVKTMSEAFDIANEIAPEHLEVCVDNPLETLMKIRNAGSIFLGRSTPEALGDYYAGPNHTLPTMGTARFSSPLSVDDFVKKSQYMYYTPEALQLVADDVEKFANSEELTGHARSISIRCE